MKDNPLEAVGPPWILLADLGSDRFAVKANEFRAGGGQVIKVDGADARTPDALFEQFAQAAKLPSYFGRNWPALDECMADLEWLPSTGYVVMLRNPGMLLDSSPLDRTTFVKLIRKVAVEWARPVSVGGVWDRPSIPFHLVAGYSNNGGFRSTKLGFAPRHGVAWLGSDASIID